MGAGTDSSGVTTLVALDGRTATRLIWPAGASAPAAAGDVAVPPPGPVIPIWDVNSRGDLLDVERSGSGQLRAVVSDAGAGTAGFRAPAGAEQVAGALGADGTAVVAWTRSDDEDALPKVWVRIRRGRGSFAPAVVIPARGPVRAVAVDVATDGRIALALAVWNGHRHVILHTEPRADGRFTVPVRLGSTPASDLLYLAALAGGPGSGRVVFTADMREETLAAVLRTGPSTWGAPQRLEPGSGDDAEFFGTALAPLADGASRWPTSGASPSSSAAHRAAARSSAHRPSRPSRPTGPPPAASSPSIAPGTSSLPGASSSISRQAGSAS